MTINTSAYEVGVWYDARDIRKGCDITNTHLRLLRHVTRRSRLIVYIGLRTVPYNGSTKECHTWERQGSRGGKVRIYKFERIKNRPKILVWRAR